MEKTYEITMETTGTATVEIPIESLANHPDNLRKEYPAKNISEMADSIKAKGLYQNLVVVKNPDKEGGFYVVIGNKRLKAAKKAGLETLPCRVADMSDQEVIEAMLVENMARKSLTLSEEAAGIQMCLEDFGFTVKDLSKSTGLSATTIRHRRNMAKLDRGVLESKMSDASFNLTVTDIQSLEKVKDVDKRNEILEACTGFDNLAWRVSQAVREAEDEKSERKILSLLVSAGVPEMEGVSYNDVLGSSRWVIVKRIVFDDANPEGALGELTEGDLDGAGYVKGYRSFYVVKKKPKEKKELTPEQMRDRAVRKNRKMLKGMLECMREEMEAFTYGMINGEISTDGVDGHVPVLWNALIRSQMVLDPSSVSAVADGKQTWEMSPDEREAFYRRLESVPVPLQMLCHLLKLVGSLTLIDADNRVIEGDARILGCACRMLEAYGFIVGQLSRQIFKGF